MKKSTISIIALIVIIIAGFWYFGRSSKGDLTMTPSTEDTSSSAPVTETTKVSSKTSQYQNAELGFAVNYPTAWEADNTDNGVIFIMPIDHEQVSTVAKLEADVTVTGTKCSFPPVTTIKDRGTITVGNSTFNTISMTNTVQGRGYFNRMYSLQKGDICYFFTFSSITQSPESKNLTGSNLTQAQNNNKAIVSQADSDFTTMVKSFTFVQGPQGVDEASAPKK